MDLSSEIYKLRGISFKIFAIAEHSDIVGTTAISYLNLKLMAPLGNQPSLLGSEDLADLFYQVNMQFYSVKEIDNQSTRIIVVTFLTIMNLQYINHLMASVTDIHHEFLLLLKYI